MKVGRPPLPPEHRKVRRFVFDTTGSLAEDIRQFADYQGVTVQELTRRWWQRAIEKYPDFRVTENQPQK